MHAPDINGPSSTANARIHDRLVEQEFLKCALYSAIGCVLAPAEAKREDTIMDMAGNHSLYVEKRAGVTVSDGTTVRKNTPDLVPYQELESEKECDRKIEKQ